MKKLTIALSIIFLGLVSSTTNAQTLGEKVQAMQNRNRTGTYNNNRVRTTTWDNANRSNEYDRRRSQTYRRGNRPMYKHDNGLHKGWYKNNNGKGRKKW